MLLGGVPGPGEAMKMETPPRLFSRQCLDVSNFRKFSRRGFLEEAKRVAACRGCCYPFRLREQDNLGRAPLPNRLREQPNDAVEKVSDP